MTFPETVQKQMDEGRADPFAAMIEQSAVIFFFFGLFFPFASKLYAESATHIIGSPEFQSDIGQDELYRIQRATKIVCQTILDSLRFGLSRGVLMQVSSSLFFLILAKDVISTFWHFGVKFSDSTFVFFFRAVHPDPFSIASLKEESA